MRQHAPQSERNATPSITDFMTDGALPALCRTLSELCGVTIRLRDPKGRVILPTDGSPPWKHEQIAPDPGALVIPLLASGRELGSIEVPTPGDSTLADAISLLARTVTEICEGQIELRHAVDEITVLFKLSSLLAGAGGVESILQIGLESTLDVLGLDAGAIVLFPEQDDGRLSEDEKDLRFAASIGLTDEWLNSPVPLSKDRIFDRLALAGEVVLVEDLRHDDRVQLDDAIAREGLVSAILAGMVIGDRPIGIVRAYARQPRRFTPSDERLIKSIGQQLAVAVNQARLLEVQREEQRMQRQLRLAADVQRRMLPAGRPNVAPFNIAARWTPSIELAGDFYDFPSQGTSVGIAVGDVVGKGVAAALLMAAVRASLRAHADEGHPVNEVIDRVNRDLCRDTRPEEFATIWYAQADPASLTLSYAAAGHDPPILARISASGQPELIGVTGGGLIAGVDPDQVYESYSLQLQPGDVLVAYTDGVTDALDFTGARFTRDRLRQAIARSLTDQPDGCAADVLDAIFRELRGFTGLAPRTDDRTVVVLRVAPDSSE